MILKIQIFSHRLNPNLDKKYRITNKYIITCFKYGFYINYILINANTISHKVAPDCPKNVTSLGWCDNLIENG